MLVAGAAAGLAGAGIVRVLSPAAGDGLAGALVVVCSVAMAGAVLYALAARLLRIAEFRAVMSTLQIR
jgi:hypothetical protein